MQPYFIRDGDYLAQLAFKMGFDADTVWNDPANAQLRQTRTNPNILFPGDTLYVPGTAAQPTPTSLTPGSSNNFVSNTPTTTLAQKFVGPDATAYASRPYVVQELPQLTGLTTDSDGVATFQIPLTLATATVVFSDTGEAWTLQIGSLNPIDTLSGIFARLQNLGYISQTETFDATNASNNLPTVRAALQQLKADQGPSSSDAAPSSAPSSSSASAPPPASAPPASVPPQGSASPADASPPSTGPGSSPTPPSSSTGSQPGGGPDANGDADAPPSSGPAPDPLPDMPFTSSAGDDANAGQGPDSAQGADSGQGANASPDETFGLSDDGTLDADTSALLVQLHGC